MTEENKTDRNIEAIAKIISLTQDGSLEWSPEEVGNISDKYTDNIIDSVFVSNYNGKILRTYRRKYKGKKNDPFANIFNVKPTTPEMVWYADYVLELVNEDRISLWQFPSESMIKDLQTAIKFKVSGADDLISSLLND